MSFTIPERSDEDIIAGEGLSMMPAPSFSERLSAQAEETRILKDLNGRAAQIEREYVDGLKSRLGPYQQSSPDDPRVTPEERRYDWLLRDIEAAKAADPEQFADLPATMEDFDAAVIERRQAELRDAQELLGRSDGWTAELLGDLWAEVTTPQGAMMLLTGASGGARILTTMAIEGTMAAADELRTIPRQSDVAEDLGQPQPGTLRQLGTAFAVGAGLGGLMSGAARLFEYGRARSAATGAIRPRDMGALQHEKAVSAEEERLQAEVPAPASTTPAGPLRGALGDVVPLRLADFNFAPGGNAAPDTNRIGYVFGKLIARGMDPHVAQGFVANFMVEATPGLNPAAVGDGGNALGIAQWNGPRRRALQAFAEARGKSATDLDTQIDFLFHELDGPEAGAWARIRQAGTAEDAARLVSELFERPGIPHLGRRIAHATGLRQQYEAGMVPRWTGTMPDVPDFSGSVSSRPYTSSGQRIVGEDLRIDVRYEVVDLASLRQARGDLQPRDRGRAASDAWVNDTAARLDPAQLLDSPWADRGAPIVGPDDTIESGNGRVRAIARAYERVPDRADVYRQAIEARTGQPIPEGIERPVLIARRTTELSDDARRRMVIDAQDSGVARMTATERARVGRQALNADLMGQLQPGRKLGSAENRDFARAFAGAFPRSERNAFIGPDGRISADGIRQLQDSLFARAWDAPDIIARALEAEPGEMKSLMDALAAAAPEMARLRAEIDAGLVRPEMDITPFVIEAVRLIAAARDMAQQGSAVARLIEDLLSQVDMLDGPIAPLTQAIVRMIMPDGRQISGRKLAEFLSRYAEEARKAGRVGDALDPVSPLDILKRLDPEAFGDLAETGSARIVAEPAPLDPVTLPENAFADGAMSPEAEVGDNRAMAMLMGEAAAEDRAAREAAGLMTVEGIEIELPGVGKWTGQDLLDDLEKDSVLDVVIDLCASKLGGAA